MKIALLIDTLATGGAQRQIVNLTKALKSNGIYDELSLHYYHNRNEYVDDLKDIKRNFSPNNEFVFAFYEPGTYDIVDGKVTNRKVMYFPQSDRKL